MDNLRKSFNKVKLVHGGDIYSAIEGLKALSPVQLLDFSANLNPLGLPEGVKKIIADSVDQYASYPDPLCRELVSHLSAYEGVPEEWILCGNGAADLIFRLVYGIKPKKAMVLAPTFAEYEEALNQVSCQVLRYELKKESNFQLDEGIIESLDEELDMLFICNPNNPTGQLISKEAIYKILLRCKELNILLVVDECFNSFLENEDRYSAKEYVKDFNNLLILKAFTKIYAMAGLRLGHCLLKDDSLKRRMIQGGQPWSVSVVAQIAGIQAIKEKDYVTETKKLLSIERSYLMNGLIKLGVSVISSGANYIFFWWPYHKEICLHEKLFEKGILIRNCDNYHGLSNGYYRICIKKHEENRRLITAIDREMNGCGS